MTALPLPADTPRAAAPLCVDLDGTLIRTDLLAEAALEFVRRQPGSAWRLPLWALRGRLRFKNELAARVTLDPKSLPYRRELLDHIEHHRAEGGSCYLVTASPAPWAAAISAHLGLFDEAIGSDAARNLKGRAKAAYLRQRFEHSGFAYVGDSRADRPVWQAAQTRLGAGSAAARHLQLDDRIFRDPAGGAAALLRAMRPHQWLKNLLVFVALLAAHRVADPAALVAALLAFAAFSLCASSAYLINDLVDLPVDRVHPRKAGRPFASGAASIGSGVLLAPALLAAAAGLCLLLPPAFAVILAVYFATTLAYSFTLKRRALVDVFTLAGLYTTRVIAGAAAIGVSISIWLLAFSMFMFLSLALLKRQTELLETARRAAVQIAGRGYRSGDAILLTALGIASGFASVVVFCLYVAHAFATQLYRTPALLWLICPLLLYWLSRMWLLAERGQMDDDPIVFTARDPISRAIVAACLVIAAAAATIDMPFIPLED
jgi:4-hydroxybenzoate polyprenyltransferase